VGDDGVTCPPWPGAVPTSTVIRLGGCARPILADQAGQHEREHPKPAHD
jgi:hypothetical protein